MKHIESVLEKGIKNLYQSSSLDEGKKILKDVISNTKIKDQDKSKMLSEIDKIQNLTKLQFYATNCMFKYEGLSVNSVIYK